MKSQPVELVDTWGSDISPAAAAWYSTASALTDERLKRVPAMLRTLALGDEPENLPHSVPFEVTAIQFRVTSEIATHIHVLKHRVGMSVSSQSQRYMQLKEDLYYVPDDWPEDMRQEYLDIMHRNFAFYHKAIRGYEAAGMSRKRAKEAARFVLPYATQIHYLVTFNLLSFVHFQRLRNSDHAQVEIRLIAEEMLRLVKEAGNFKHSLEAWGL